LNKEGELNSEAFHVFMKQQLKDHMLSQLVSSMVVADSVQHSMISTLKLILSQVTKPPPPYASCVTPRGSKAWVLRVPDTTLRNQENYCQNETGVTWIGHNITLSMLSDRSFGTYWWLSWPALWSWRGSYLKNALRHSGLSGRGNGLQWSTSSVTRSRNHSIALDRSRVHSIPLCRGWLFVTPRGRCRQQIRDHAWTVLSYVSCVWIDTGIASAARPRSAFKAAGAGAGEGRVANAVGEGAAGKDEGKGGGQGNDQRASWQSGLSRRLVLCARGM